MGQGRSWPFADAPNGLVITDVSDYQLRLTNPQIRIISTLFYPDQGTAESMIPVKIQGHPYIITIDEAGAASASDGWPGACTRGFPAFGYPQLVDVADETNPKIIAKLRLQVDDPANCEALRLETPPDAPGTAYVMMHHSVGDIGDGEIASWGYPEGGMGAVGDACAAAARSFGAEIRTNARVERVLVRDGRTVGVALGEGAPVQQRYAEYLEIIGRDERERRVIALAVSGRAPALDFERRASPAPGQRHREDGGHRVDAAQRRETRHQFLEELPLLRFLPVFGFGQR
jgi:hypothetical protein